MTLSPSDIDAIRAAEKALAEAFEAPDPTAWVDFYTEDAIFAGPGVPTIQGRADFLEAARETVISSMQITAESTLGSDDFAAMFGRATWVSGPGAPMPLYADAVCSWSGAGSPTGGGASRVSCSTRTREGSPWTHRWWSRRMAGQDELARGGDRGARPRSAA